MRTIAAIFVTLSLGCCACAGSHAENITCRIEEETVQRFSDAVFPMVLTGKKRVTVKILGAAVSQDFPWEATVSKPVITINQESQTFSADVRVDSVSAFWEGKVAGRLVISYDPKKNVVIIQVADAIVPVTIGAITVEIDVSKEIPDLSFQVMSPQLTIPFRGKTIRVQTKPHIEFEDGAIVVKTDVAFAVK